MKLQEKYGLQNSPGGGGKPYLATGLLAYEQATACILYHKVSVVHVQRVT